MKTITSSDEISALFKHGRWIKTPYMTLIVGKAEQKEPLGEKEPHDPLGRVAFIAGKKLGNAVWRNRAKRRLRELCRAAGGPWPGYDVVFLARSSLCSVPYSKALKACNTAVGKMTAHDQG